MKQDTETHPCDIKTHPYDTKTTQKGNPMANKAWPEFFVVECFLFVHTPAV